MDAEAVVVDHRHLPTARAVFKRKWSVRCLDGENITMTFRRIRCLAQGALLDRPSFRHWWYRGVD